MKIIILILVHFFILPFSLFAQADSLQQQINQQVWRPFIRSFNENDTETFQSVHSKDLIRVIMDNHQLLGYEQYFKPVPDSIRSNRGKWKKSIELRFIQRMASTDKGFEVGYYKVSNSDMASGKRFISYGKFQVLLRKENGVWKILMDEDAKENTDESVFLTGKPND